MNYKDAVLGLSRIMTATIDLQGSAVVCREAAEMFRDHPERDLLIERMEDTCAKVKAYNALLDDSRSYISEDMVVMSMDCVHDLRHYIVWLDLEHKASPGMTTEDMLYYCTLIESCIGQIEGTISTNLSSLWDTLGCVIEDTSEVLNYDEEAVE